jgi:hypothetical protein
LQVASGLVGPAGLLTAHRDELAPFQKTKLNRLTQPAAWIASSCGVVTGLRDPGWYVVDRDDAVEQHHKDEDQQIERESV